MKLSVGKFAVWVLVILALLILFGQFLLLVVPIFFGWFSFVQRVLPKVTINWNGVGMVALCSVLILLGIHSFCVWFFNHASTTGNKETGQKWRWSWSVSLYLAVWLLFTASMGAVGVAHQVGWLVRSKEPLFKVKFDSFRRRYQVQEKAIDLRQHAEQAHWDLDITRSEFLKDQAGLSIRYGNVFEDLHVLFLEGTNGQLAASLIFHRDPELRATTGFVIISPEMPEREIQPIAQLPAVLARFESRTNSVPPGR